MVSTVVKHTRKLTWPTCIIRLDRCIQHHESSGKNDTQNLFAIVQGGLDSALRDKCLDAMLERKDRVTGYAIGGLSGGEEKGLTSPLGIYRKASHISSTADVFWKMWV